MSKKIFILVPDGVSLRNFAYTSFYKLGIEKGYKVIFWNNTPFDLNSLGYNQINFEKPKLHPITDILKSVITRVEINLFGKRESDAIYNEYLFPLSFSGFKKSFKSILVLIISYLFSSEKGILKLRSKINNLERSTPYFQNCKKILELENPDFIFCTSQRSITSIAPLLAAKELGIPSASFIFSWDNVPKATTVVTTDYYFVWSDYMKNELISYQKYILNSQVFVTGTPQFEPQFEKDRLLTRQDFFVKNNIDINCTLLCFSGDDITTSPKDELYLRDVANAIRILNKSGQNIKLIFRRCPVDFSGRYKSVIKEFADEIIDMPPLWKKIGNQWNTILPTKEDLNLQANIIAHSIAVINLASSMVFEYICHEKPCAYLNYNYLNKEETSEKGVYLYDYVHFRSMPSQESVIWLSDPENIAEDIQKMIQGVPETITYAKQWFETINMHPPQEASSRIWNVITKIIS